MVSQTSYVLKERRKKKGTSDESPLVVLGFNILISGLVVICSTVPSGIWNSARVGYHIRLFEYFGKVSFWLSSSQFIFHPQRHPNLILSVQGSCLFTHSSVQLFWKYKTGEGCLSVWCINSHLIFFSFIFFSFFVLMFSLIVFVDVCK